MDEYVVQTDNLPMSKDAQAASFSTSRIFNRNSAYFAFCPRQFGLVDSGRRNRSLRNGKFVILEESGSHFCCCRDEMSLFEIIIRFTC